MLRGAAYGKPLGTCRNFRACAGKAVKLPGEIHKRTAMTQSDLFLLSLTRSQLEIILVLVALYAIGAGLVLKRIGFSAWWALFALIPITALAGIWALAFVRWPTPRSTPD